MALNNALREIIPDFDYLRLKEAGEGKILAARFKKGCEFKLDDLSDGQRMMIALYTILYCLPEEGAALCVDEPENFLALSEIQPWLDELEERCESGPFQVLLISHHPRPINYLSQDAGLWFERSGINQPSRAIRINEEESGISMAQLVERG